MSEINGIYAASVSILDKNLRLDISKTIKHAENLIDQGCHGVAILGSTGQAQLISLEEKIKLIEELSKSKYKKNFIVGTGFNSLSDTILLMKKSQSLGMKKFLIMPPAYYFYKDKDVINFYNKIIENISDCKIILYNFEKLAGYKFSLNCVEELKNRFPDQIVGIKDSTYNIYDKYKKNDLSILVGSEEKLLSGLKVGCSGAITATCNVTSKIARKVFDDYHLNIPQTLNEKLCKVRKVFNQFNLISGLHSFMSQKDPIFKNVLPIIDLLSESEEKKLFEELKKLEFN